MTIEMRPHDILRALRRDYGLPEDNALWPPEPDEGIEQIDTTLNLVNMNRATIDRFGGHDTLATRMLLCLWAFSDELKRSDMPVTFAAPEFEVIWDAAGMNAPQVVEDIKNNNPWRRYS